MVGPIVSGMRFCGCVLDSSGQQGGCLAADAGFWLLQTRDCPGSARAPHGRVSPAMAGQAMRLNPVDRCVDINMGLLMRHKGGVEGAQGNGNPVGEFSFAA